MLRIRYVIPDLNYFHPGSEFFPSRIRTKEFKYFNPQKGFLSSGKYDPGCSSRMRNTAAAAVESAITDNNGIDPRSRIYINTLRIRNTESDHCRLSQMLLEVPSSA